MNPAAWVLVGFAVTIPFVGWWVIAGIDLDDTDDKTDDDVAWLKSLRDEDGAA